ncbi:MAG: 8-oxoguanine deaminase, partial [Pseudomonas sp.]|nr:8-oxoguanine deaminase [Pseudomonas sp.]
MAKTLLVKNAELLVTMDGERREIRRGGLFIEDNLIKQVGPSESLPQQADVILDMTGKVV